MFWDKFILSLEVLIFWFWVQFTLLCLSESHNIYVSRKICTIMLKVKVLIFKFLDKFVLSCESESLYIWVLRKFVLSAMWSGNFWDKFVLQCESLNICICICTVIWKEKGPAAADVGDGASGVKRRATASTSNCRLATKISSKIRAISFLQNQQKTWSSRFSEKQTIMGGYLELRGLPQLPTEVWTPRISSKIVTERIILKKEGPTL